MNIFVAKLNFRTSDAKLLECFQSFGTVNSAKVIFDKMTGKSKGFGFVEMPNDDEANNAINNLNETEFDGARIVVKKAIDKESGSGRSGGGDRPYQKRPFNRGGSGGNRFDGQRGGGGNGGYKPRFSRDED